MEEQTNQPAGDAASVEPSYLIKHWRGDLSLAMSYWVNGIIVSIGFNLGVRFCSAYWAPLVSPLTSSCLFLTAFLSVGIWQVVGIWRSASYHVERGGRSEWANLAKIIMVVWVIRFAVTVGDTFDQPAARAAVPEPVEVEVQVVSETDDNLSTASKESFDAGPTEGKFRVEEDQTKRDRAKAEALLSTGQDFYSGIGVEVDFTKAADYFLQAAELGSADAQHNLAVCYRQGDGVDQDYKQAAFWYRKAADQGLAESQESLAGMYDEGRGVPKSSVEAASWRLKAARQGFLCSQYNLGVCYMRGDGVLRNYVEAYKWFLLAATQANPADALKLQGISGDAGSRLAIINGVTFANDETAEVTTRFGRVSVKCILITPGMATIRINGERDTRILFLDREGSDQPSELLHALAKSMQALEQRMTRSQTQEAQRRAVAFEAGEGDDWGTAGDALPVPRNGAVGTGFFVTADGFVITCEHVVRGATSIRVKSAAMTYRAKLIRKNRVIDLALLKVEGNFSALPILSKPKVDLGDSVFTIGFPNPDLQGEKPKLTRGEISALSGIRDHPRYFQISVPVQPGNSGGALVDELGNVVGVVTARLDDATAYKFSGALPQNVNYALKSDLVRTFISDIPEASGKLKVPNAVRNRESASAAAERAAVLVIAE